MARKAVALVSGGLDSSLAVYLIKRQGIDVVGLHSTSFFSNTDPADKDGPVELTADQLGIQVLYREKGPEFLEIIRNPRYGHGKNLNPCVDCRIYTLVKAKEVMAEVGASFLVTGEVVGQRPMSQQRHTMRLIEKRSGCDGIILRPLSAKILPPTVPEQTGLVDREQLLEVAGRGRKVQLKLAADIGLTGHSSPAGGCLLTDRSFARRLKDLLEDRECPSRADLETLGLGRHVRLRPGLKIVVGRRHEENERLLALAEAGTLFVPDEFPGPVVLAQGNPDPEEEMLIGSIIRRYAKESTRGTSIEVVSRADPTRRLEVSAVAPHDWICERMI